MLTHYSVDVNLPNGRVYKRSRITTKNTRIHEKKQIELEKYIERTQRIQEQQLEKRKETKNTIQKRIEVKGIKYCPLIYTHLIINTQK